MKYQQKKNVLKRGATLLLAAAGLSLLPTLAMAADQAEVHSFHDMLSQGTVDGQIRALYYDNNNAFFIPNVQRRYVFAYGGKLGYTTAALNGFSARVSFYAQRHAGRSTDSAGYNRDLGPNLNPLTEAYVQWQGDKLLIRAGDQKLNAPFTDTSDFRIIPQTYQGVKIKYGSQDNNVTAMRMFRYKSRIDDNFQEKTNFNSEFIPFPPNTNETTDGFWALGAHGATATQSLGLKGQAWYFNYMDYANLYYADGQATWKRDGVKPFIGIQYARERDTGDALMGKVDNNTYGVKLGVKKNSVTASLAWNHMAKHKGSFRDGALLTPYATQESSGPLFAQPFLQSTQDLGVGDAYSFNVSGATFANTFMGARYTYLDFNQAGGNSNFQEYLLFAIYNFQGALKGFSVSDFFAYETRDGNLNANDAYLENRLSFQYDF